MSGMTTDTPYFEMSRDKLQKNLDILLYIERRAGAKILHTVKSFNQPEALRIITQSISGASIGNLNELPSSISDIYIHSYAPYFHKRDIADIAKASNSMSLNSLYQWDLYSEEIGRDTSLGLRINPKLTIKQPRYCNPNRSAWLGVDEELFLSDMAHSPERYEGLKGLHFHVLCSQELGGLKYLLAHIDKNFSAIMPHIEWINLGGGHNFTGERYDIDGLIALLNNFTKKHQDIQLIFEPGESVVKESGVFVTTVVDIIDNSIAILDTSIEAHMLDIAITKISPEVVGASKDSGEYRYQLTGMSCIAGDIIGDYYFDKPLKIGDRVIFADMMGYSMVKQTEFNGIEKAEFRLVRAF
ncbi:Carboxynorspermidine decarboxylase, putative [hydrothermal vent metagenome]|uniref:Carboxynorspermidine decarboxylase, putative n=1 Tax=hydrothermal vent metagenome TaxID=652676 RepID=A0A1W1B8Z4_9ZZZZ